jgi:cysteinyl-tRNA synthetase
MTTHGTPLRLYDTLRRQNLEVVPADGKTLRFYCCGPTVYGPAHIGNFRTFVLQDVFRRVVELSGVPTRHVRNITDVDDKTIRDSRAQGRDLREFTAFWRDRFQEDCRRLNLLPPHVEPGAVDHIPHQIGMIGKLMAGGHAYQGGDGSVYFRVSSFPRYGKLSHLDEREIVLGASANDADEYQKDALADFALWKARKPEDGGNFWPSPWGEGRPGWHLECSAMSHEYLGEGFDLHSGGVDLCFPHHENEIAQSEAATGREMCRHWFHITHLMVNGGKMSKSLGNFYTLSELAERGFTPAELRYALVSSHYRQPLNFVSRDKSGEETFPSLTSARQAMERLAKAARRLAERAGNPPVPAYGEFLGGTDPGVFAPAWQALLDDMNTPEALGQIFTALRDLEDAEPLAGFRGLHFMLAALGLVLPEEQTAAPVPEAIRDLAQKRWEAKLSRDWARADAFRLELAALGWQIKDGKEGYEILPSSPNPESVR